jgi:hypothetical protein
MKAPNGFVITLQLDDAVRARLLDRARSAESSVDELQSELDEAQAEIERLKADNKALELGLSVVGHAEAMAAKDAEIKRLNEEIKRLESLRSLEPREIERRDATVSLAGNAHVSITSRRDRIKVFESHGLSTFVSFHGGNQCRVEIQDVASWCMIRAIDVIAVTTDKDAGNV